MNKPIFINSFGNTIRIDPQTTQTSCIRLQIINQKEYNDEGNTINLPQVFETYLHIDDVNSLIEALKSSYFIPDTTKS